MGKTQNEVKSFSDMIVAKDDLVVGDYDSPEQVLKSAYIHNTALALADNDLAPDGDYPVFTWPPTAKEEDDIAFQVVVFKRGKEIQIGYRVNQKVEKHYRDVVLPMLHEAYEHEIETIKANGLKVDEHWVGAKYDVPMWIHFDIMLNHDDITELEYEGIIARDFPQLWIAEHCRPTKLYL